MRLWLSALCLLLVLAPPVTADDWERGVDLYNRGEYEAALAEFQDIVLEDPGLEGAWYYIGLCEFKLKRYDRVELPLSRAIELLTVRAPNSPDITGAWYTIGISLFLLNENERAVEPLKRYVERARSEKREVDRSALSALGRVFYALERWDESLAVLKGLTPNGAREDSTDQFLVGAIYFKRENDDRAIPPLREAVKADPANVSALEMLAESLMRKARKSPKSTAEWEEAARVGEQLREARDDPRTASILGRAYLGGGEFDKAVGPLGRLAKANTGDGQAWLYYGIALSRSGQMRKAMEALEITIQLIPDSTPALSELGYVYEKDGQYQQALRIYEKAFSLTGEPSFKEGIERVRALLAQQP